MKKKETMDIVFLLDRSGSMRGMEYDTIGGYNSYLDNMQNKNAYVTTVLFDNRYEMLTQRKPISQVPKLTKETYYTRGTTALLDAIGNTINYIDKNEPSKVLFIITTDGLENASTDYNRSQIKELIESHSNWEFIFLGADIDSYSEASSLGIKRDHISNYSKTRKGMNKMFKCLENVSMEYAKCSSISSTWKDELEEYLDTKKE